MRASTPVAASPEGLIVSFDYDILCHKAANDDKLIEEVGGHLERLINYRSSLICVPEDQWQTLRSNYIAQLRTGQTDDPDNPSPDLAHDGDTPPEESPEEENTIASKAIEMFGKEIVEIE